MNFPPPVRKSRLLVLMGNSLLDLRLVRLMAFTAGGSAGVLFRIDLREPLRLSRVRLVAANTERCGVRPRRLHRRWIVGMFRQSAVTRFAPHAGMRTGLLRFGDIAVAQLASLVPRVGDGPGGD